MEERRCRSRHLIPCLLEHPVFPGPVKKKKFLSYFVDSLNSVRIITLYSGLLTKLQYLTGCNNSHAYLTMKYNFIIPNVAK